MAACGEGATEPPYDVVEYLRGIATNLMEIDAKLDRITGQSGEDDDAEEEEGS